MSPENTAIVVPHRRGDPPHRDFGTLDNGSTAARPLAWRWTESGELGAAGSLGAKN